jgi:spoIIIJ-associated protein
MVSNALRNNEYELTRVNVDIADYKKQRAERIKEQAEEWVKQVKDSKEPLNLKPMNPADRRVVHQVASDNDLASESAGEGRDRHIVLSLKKD